MSASSKSSRAAADLFELYVVKEMARLFGLTFNYGNELLAARSRLELAHPGSAAERESEQMAKAIRIATLIHARIATDQPELVAIRVVWVGSAGIGLSDAAADLRIESHNTESIDISLKSVKEGNGTSRNLGGSAILDIFGVDVEHLRDQMYEEVLDVIRDSDEARWLILSALSVGKRKDAFTQPEKDIAKVIGKKWTGVLANAVAISWVGLSMDKRLAFLNLAMGLDSSASRTLYIAIADPKMDRIRLASGISAPNDVAVIYDTRYPQRVKFQSSEVGLSVQFNCTNGLGISALCGRVFDE